MDVKETFKNSRVIVPDDAAGPRDSHTDNSKLGPLRLENLNTQLHDINMALSIFAQNTEREREEIERRIALKLRNLIIPMVQRLRNDQALRTHEAQLDMLTKQIEDLTSGFTIDSRVAMSLSYNEMRIASLNKGFKSPCFMGTNLSTSFSEVFSALPESRLTGIWDEVTG